MQHHGSKTTQIAALTNNLANITACEMNNIRAERLKYNLDKQGVTSAVIMKVDSRKIDEFFSFDRILLDAPCSGSGILNINDEKCFKYFTEELIKKSSKTQAELLKKAINLLKNGKEMVYSTCSILQVENEDIIRKAIEQKKVEIIPIDLENDDSICKLPVTIPGTLCVCPTEEYEGFFVAKLRKL